MNEQQLYERLFAYIESLLQDTEKALSLHRQTVSANYLQKKIYECDGAMNFIKGLFNNKLITQSPEQRTVIDKLDDRITAIENEIETVRS